MNAKFRTEDLRLFVRLSNALDAQLPKSTAVATGYVHVHYIGYRKFLAFAKALAESHLHSRERAESKRLELARQGRELRAVSDQVEDSPMAGVQGSSEGPPDAS